MDGIDQPRLTYNVAVRARDHERRYEEYDEQSSGASSQETASRMQFQTSGALPPVSDDHAEPSPSASDRAYDDIPHQLVDIVRRGNEDDFVQMLDAYPSLQMPILAAIGRVHGTQVARTVGAKSKPTLDASPAKAPAKNPEGYDGGPIRVDSDQGVSDRSKVAGWDQVAAGVAREQSMPSHVRLPKSLVRELDRLWNETVRKDKEHGGNVVGGRDSYEFRQTHDKHDNQDTYNPDLSNVDGDHHVAIVHTHPTDNDSPDYVGFSDVDLAALVDEEQPLNILRSGTQTYMVARTKEFEALIDKNNDPEKLAELKIAIHQTYKAAYGAEKSAGSGEPSRVEAGVLAVCRKFHLIYYWGQGQDLHRVR
jgi:hypothetical protein